MQYLAQKKIIIMLLLTITFMPNSIYTIDQNNLPEPYKSVMLLKPDFHGWLSDHNKRKLQDFVTALQPQIILEVGSWLGLSAIFFASLVPNETKIYAVDHWQGSIEHHSESQFHSKLSILYQQFLSNIIHSGTADKIIPVKMSSLEAAQILNIKPNLIYIDGSHKEKDVFDDIMAWYPKLSSGGILCGDDYNWGSEKYGGIVRNGVNKAAQILGLPVFVEGDIFWYFPPKK